MYGTWAELVAEHLAGGDTDFPAPEEVLSDEILFGFDVPWDSREELSRPYERKTPRQTVKGWYDARWGL